LFPSSTRFSLSGNIDRDRLLHLPTAASHYISLNRLSPQAAAAPSIPVSQQPTHGSARATLFFIFCNRLPASLLPPATLVDPIASSGGPITAVPTDQSHPSFFCQATRSGGEDKKPIEESICSEADLKEKREKHIRKP
jgi:hypothetical protein